MAIDTFIVIRLHDLFDSYLEQAKCTKGLNPFQHQIYVPKLQTFGNGDHYRGRGRPTTTAQTLIADQTNWPAFKRIKTHSDSATIKITPIWSQPIHFLVLLHCRSLYHNLLLRLLLFSLPTRPKVVVFKLTHISSPTLLQGPHNQGPNPP